VTKAVAPPGRSSSAAPSSTAKNILKFSTKKFETGVFSQVIQLFLTMKHFR